jgi:hypothetical protein
MRRRPDVAVYLSPPAVAPGETLTVEARLKSRAETPTRGAKLTLTGREWAQYGQFSSGLDVVALEASFQPATLPTGERSLKARFVIPPTAPPSAKGTHVGVAYQLRVQVDIPWWPDVDKLFDVPVRKIPIRPPDEALVFTSTAQEVTGDALYAEASLESRCVAPGGVLSGAVSFFNTRGKQIEPELSLVAWERSSSGLSTVEGVRYGVKLQGPARDGEAIAFRVGFPAGAPPSLAGRFASITWKLEVAVRTLLSRRVILDIPIEVGPVEADTRSARLQVVGLARRNGLWKDIGARAGMRLDEERGVLVAEQGVVSVTVEPELRVDDGPVLVTRLGWPDLGIDVGLEERQFIEILPGPQVQTGDKPFDRRFKTTAREPAQARALLAEDVRRRIARFQSVRIDDEGAVLSSPGAGLEPRETSAFVANALRLALAIDGAIPAIPVPRAALRYAEAWASYAAAMGGRFVRGRVGFVAATFHGRRLDAGLSWKKSGEVDRTEILLATSGDDSAARKQATALWDELERRGTVSLTERGLLLSLPEGIEDPRAIEPLLDTLSSVADVMEKKNREGPYR